MKTKLFFALFIGIRIICQGQDTSKVSACYIGSHGYLLKSSKSKVAIDALIYWEGDNYGYIKPPKALADKMETAASPFDSLDLILIGHAHNDHYNTEIVERSMLKNENVVLVTTPQVLLDLKSKVDSFDFYSDRIWVPDLQFYESADTIINAIPLTITSIPHGSSNMELYVPSFELDSIRFVQLNGWNSLTADAYDTLGFNRKQADVIFLCYSYIIDNAKNKLFTENLQPRYSTISHVDGATSVRLKLLQDSIQKKQDQYPMNMLCIPMEELQYIKINDTILVDTLNSAPVQIIEAENLETNINELFSYTLPEDLFSDKEDDIVTITVTSANGGALPAWLKYNPETRILEGTPVSLSTTYFRINGTDSQLATRSITIRIKINSVNKIDIKTTSLLKIYPNPAEGKIFVNFEGNIAEYEIYDIPGKLLLHGSVENAGTIDISTLKNGIYNIRLKIGTQLFNNSIIIE